MKRANKKYRETHKEKINEIARNFYNKHKDNEEFKKANREKAKRSYEKKQKELNKEVKPRIKKPPKEDFTLLVLVT